MTTHTGPREAHSNGDASPTSSTSSQERPSPSIGRSSFELIYASLYGFVIGFCIAAAVAVIVIFILKTSGGIEGD